MRTRNVLQQVAVAAALGRRWLEADGVRVDRQQFDNAVAALDWLAKLIEPVTPPDTERNLSDDGLMTTADVAATVGVGAHAVRKAAREGRLTATRTAEGWRYTADAVTAWKDSRRG